MRLLLLFFLASFVTSNSGITTILTHCQQSNYQWITYKNAEGRFSIKFPLQPTLEQVNHRLNGQNVARYLFGAHGDLESFQLSYYDIPADKALMDVLNKNIEKYYDIITKSTASELNGQIITQSTFTYGNYVGREIRLDGILMEQKIKHVIRVIVIGNRQYSMWFSTKPEYYRLNLMYEFFNSFKYN